VIERIDYKAKVIHVNRSQYDVKTRLNTRRIVETTRRTGMNSAATTAVSVREILPRRELTRPPRRWC